ncbi:MAG: SLBB domain-containing protein [Holophaga sp.]|nr:SLBB domain-containing protein [Holophaga sp.]
MQLLAQDPVSALGALQTRQDPELAGTAVPGSAPETAPKGAESAHAQPGQPEGKTQRQTQEERLDLEIRRAKAKEKGPARFAADLFETRQYGINPTDGGIAEDYVLGVGDRLRLNVFGSATFDVPLEVDGRGEVAVPKVGTVPVGGLSLGLARAAVQSKVAQIFSRSTVDLSVTRLREVRVFVLGEVYKPGSFLVPSLSSIVNVIGLSGGPTRVGSFRDIRVMRGGKVIHAVDLYPLRAQGVGNLNFGFQNGDTIFIPLFQNEVRMEGAFTRVAATVPEKHDDTESLEDTDQQKALKRNIRRIEERLGLPLPFAEEKKPKSDQVKDEQWEEGRLRFGANRQAAVLSSLKTQQNMSPTNPQYLSESAQLAALGMAQAQPNSDVLGVSRGTAEVLQPAERTELEYNLEVLKDELKASREAKDRNDRRVEEKPSDTETAGQPQWFTQWLAEGKAPAMLFEMAPGETVKDAVAFAGGFSLQGFSGAVSLRRFNADGTQNVMEVPEGKVMASTRVERGDVITALPLRGFRMKSVTVSGWARVQGVFSRDDGQRVGDFLQRYGMVLPDTYLERGELVHVLADGSKRFTAFNLAKALAGDPADNPVLEDRDEINLFRVGDLRLPRFLKVVGPVTRPGNYEFIEGMRASDLLFRAGLPQEKADRYVGELARAQDRQPGSVVRLDLTRLLSTTGASPVDLRDDRVNPLLRPNDQISVFAKPDYRPRSTVILTGQVVRPGTYDLDSPKVSLRQILARAGGLTPEAMPGAGIFLRNIRPVDPERKRASILAGIDSPDITSNGINDILGRLNETKRNSTTGILQPNPLLHALRNGDISRLVVDFKGILAGDPAAEVELQDGDEVIIPRRTDVVYVVGETASPFAAFKVSNGMKVKDVVAMAGGYTRNADTWNVKLLKANGKIVDHWVSRKAVEPGDALLVPQRIRRDVNWSEQLSALTPIAILINTFK